MNDELSECIADDDLKNRFLQPRPTRASVRNSHFPPLMSVRDSPMSSLSRWMMDSPPLVVGDRFVTPVWIRLSTCYRRRWRELMVVIQQISFLDVQWYCCIVIYQSYQHLANHVDQFSVGRDYATAVSSSTFIVASRMNCVAGSYCGDVLYIAIVFREGGIEKVFWWLRMPEEHLIYGWLPDQHESNHHERNRFC